MKKILITGICALALLSSGCLSSGSATKATAYDTQQDAKIQGIETWKNEAQNALSNLKAEITKLQSTGSESVRISTLESEVASLKAQKATVDANVAALDARLKTLEGNATSGSSSTVVGNSGGISVTLDKTQLYSTSAETGNKDISATVKNNSGAGKNVTLYLSLTPGSPIEDAKITACRAKSTLAGFSDYVEGTKQHTLDVATITTKVVWVIPSFYLDNGAERSIWLQFDVKTQDTATWTIGLKAIDL